MCFEQQNSLWSTPLRFACSSHPPCHGASNISAGRGGAGHSAPTPACSPVPSALVEGSRTTSEKGQQNMPKLILPLGAWGCLHDAPQLHSATSADGEGPGWAVASVSGFSKMGLQGHFQQSPSPAPRKHRAFVLFCFNL